jgi:hypothetical protein
VGDGGKVEPRFTANFAMGAHGMLDIDKQEPWMAKRSVYLFLAVSIAYLIVAIILGTPGADGDATNNFNVFARLAHEQRYTL